MAYKYEFPYTDPHRYNADWILAKMKELTTEWAQTRAQFNQLENDFVALQNYVANYFANLDLTSEVQAILNRYLTDGTLQDILEDTFVRMEGVPAVGKKIAFFGDSWTLGNDGQGGHFELNFPRVVQDRTGMVSYNYGVGGIGFLRKAGGYNLREHIDRIYNNTANPRDFDFIVVLCGFNDFNHISDDPTISLNGIYTEAQSVIIRLNQLYHKARIIWMGANMRCQRMDDYARQTIAYVRNAVSVVNTLEHGTASDAGNWIWKMIGKEGYYISENSAFVHPSLTGHKIIANSVIQAIYGGSNDYSLVLQEIHSGNGIWSNQSGADDTNYFVEQFNDTITVHFPICQFSSIDLSSPLESSITIPKAARPHTPQTCIVYSGTNDVLQVAILATGKIYLKRLAGSSSLANVKLYLPDISWKMYSHA